MSLKRLKDTGDEDSHVSSAKRPRTAAPSAASHSSSGGQLTEKDVDSDWQSLTDTPKFIRTISWFASTFASNSTRASGAPSPAASAPAFSPVSKKQSGEVAQVQDEDEQDHEQEEVDYELDDRTGLPIVPIKPSPVQYGLEPWYTKILGAKPSNCLTTGAQNALIKSQDDWRGMSARRSVLVSSSPSFILWVPSEGRGLLIYQRGSKRLQTMGSLLRVPQASTAQIDAVLSGLESNASEKGKKDGHKNRIKVKSTPVVAMEAEEIMYCMTHGIALLWTAEESTTWDEALVLAGIVPSAGAYHGFSMESSSLAFVEHVVKATYTSYEESHAVLLEGDVMLRYAVYFTLRDHGYVVASHDLSLVGETANHSFSSSSPTSPSAAGASTLPETRTRSRGRGESLVRPGSNLATALADLRPTAGKMSWKERLASWPSVELPSMFDVWFLPGTTQSWSRTKRPPPSFRVAVQSYNDKPPGPVETATWHAATTGRDGIPLRVAIVQGVTVTLFDLSSQIPDHTSEALDAAKKRAGTVTSFQVLAEESAGAVATMPHVSPGRKRLRTSWGWGAEDFVDGESDPLVDLADSGNGMTSSSTVEHRHGEPVPSMLHEHVETEGIDEILVGDDDGDGGAPASMGDIDETATSIVDEGEEEEDGLEESDETHDVEAGGSVVATEEVVGED